MIIMMIINLKNYLKYLYQLKKENSNFINRYLFIQ